MNLKLIFCVLAIVSATHVSAQRKILCRIIDKETNQPIKDAHIELEGTDTRTATNYLGFFELAIDSAHQILMITHPEFNPLRMVVPAEDKFKISLDRRTGQDDQSAEGNAFYMHVSRNLRYPQEARRAQVEGVVQVGFAIDDTGVPANITVLRNVGSGCGEEVVRVLKSLPPSLGQLLVSETSSKKFLLPVHFGLGKSQQSPQDPIHAEAGVFVLKVIDLTALGIERSGAPLQTSIRIVDEGAHETLSTALKNPKSAKKLSLVNQGLLEFPVEIMTLTNLQFLDLDQNKLKVIPQDLDKLVKLEELFLFSNQLQALPPSIGKLTKLKTLGLAGNQLKTIPEQVFELEKLETLDLSGNQLKELPPMIASLKNLRTLGLNGNAIHTIPSEILLLKKLEKLYIQGNPISAEEVAHLKATLKRVEVIF